MCIPQMIFTLNDDVACKDFIYQVMSVYIYNIISILDVKAVECAQLRNTMGIYLVLKLF